MRPSTSSSEASEQAVIGSDNSSLGSDSDSEEGWGFLLGGLSTESMASANWEKKEEEGISNTSGRINEPIESKNVVSVLPMGSSSREVPSYEVTGGESKQCGATAATSDNIVEQKISQRAFCLSPNGQILKPPVQILDRSCEQKGNITIATSDIDKGQVIFTEKALLGIQVVPSQTTSLADTKSGMYAVRSCQLCFRSLESASCLSEEGLPFSELWPIPEYDDPTTMECVAIGDPNEPAVATHEYTRTKSGILTCRDCGVMFCNRFCASNHSKVVGDCCRCTRAIKGVVKSIVSGERERRQLTEQYNNNLDTSNSDNSGICNCGAEQEDFGDSEALVDIDPVLILAAKMFVAHVHVCRKNGDGFRGNDGDNEVASDTLFYGLCGQAEDVASLSLGSASIPSSFSDDGDQNSKSPLPLLKEYNAIADAIELTEMERRSSSLCSLQQFQKIAAIAQRNSISLATGSPFRTYYQGMIRKTGGRGSSRQQQVVSDVARLLGAKDGKLTKDMDRIVEEKCVVKMGGIFTLTARMNHSCDPNAEIRAQEYVDCNVDIVAKKNIRRGEEICI
ncbi:unnamed protein product, partial [Pseudo-nitzschia multistriata]